MTKTNPFHKHDIYFLTLLGIIGIAITIWVFSPSDSASGVLEVRLNGTVQMRLPLGQDTDQVISSPNVITNRFRIQDGIVRMTESNCHDHTCINTRGISKPGESIVCLPHRLVLAIVEADRTSSQPDAIVR